MSVSGSGVSVLTDDIIAKEALRLLKNNVVCLPRVSRSTKKYFGDVGDTITIKKPFRVKSASGRTLVEQPLVDQSVAITVDHQEHVALGFNAVDRSLSLPDFSQRYLSSGMVQIAHQVDKSIVDEMTTSAYYSSGTPGTAIVSDEFIDAEAEMIMVGVPDDGNLTNLMNPLDAANYRKDLKGVYSQDLVKSAIENSYLGNLASARTFSTAQMGTHTNGARGGTPLVNGATAAGATTLVIDGLSNSVTGWGLKGDVFTIAGVYSINPQTYQSTGMLQKFTLTADADSDGSGNSTLSISPAINDGTATEVDGDGSTISLKAYQNVDALPADNAALTFMGAAGTTYRQNLRFHKDAIQFVPVDLVLPETAKIARKVSDPDSGLSMLMTGDYDITSMKSTYRQDVLWAVKLVYPELCHRIWSA